jgi:hypothetical protein
MALLPQDNSRSPRDGTFSFPVDSMIDTRGKEDQRATSAAGYSRRCTDFEYLQPKTCHVIEGCIHAIRREEFSLLYATSPSRYGGGHNHLGCLFWQQNVQVNRKVNPIFRLEYT